jgi:flagellar biosynthesis/type III secretory pathway protein FliH
MDKARVNYQDRCREIKEEITQSIKEGTIAGIQQGIENGFLEGIKESADMGFSNLLETLQVDSQEFLNTLSSQMAESQIENRVNERICPLLKPSMDKACGKVLENIDTTNSKSDLLDITQKLQLEDLAQEQLDQCIQTLNQFLPHNFVFSSIFNGCERALTACLMENVAECEGLLQDKIELISDIREGDSNG